MFHALETKIPYAGFTGSCFFLAWMNGAFFTSALSGFRSSGAGLASISLYWNLSLVGVFAGLVALTLFERRAGQVALRPRALAISTALVCLGTLLMLVDPSSAPPAFVALGAMGGFATGFFTALFYIAWSQVYGLLEEEQAELVIPLAVALGQLFSLVFCGLEGWLAAVCLVLAPALSGTCLLVSFRHLGFGTQGALAATDAQKQVEPREPTACDPDDPRQLAPRQSSSGDQPSRPELTGVRFGLFVAAIWLVLSLMTTLSNLRVADDFTHAYLVPFLVSFIVLLALLMLYIGYSKRLSLLQTARIVVPVMVVNLLTMLILPRDIVPDAFLVERTAVMFFWAILWIFCAKAIKRGQASATTVIGHVRGWIQGGAALSIPIGAVLQEIGYSTSLVVCLGASLLVAVFALSLPALVGASNEGALVAKGQNPVENNVEVALPPGQTETLTFAANAAEARCADLADRFSLSPRETEIMGYLVRGRDLPFIRDALYISRNTINTHVRHIYGKMGIHSKQELIDLFEQEE